MHRGRAPSPSFEHPEVNHPQRRPFVFVGQAQVFAQFQTRRAQRISNHFLLSAPKKIMSPSCAPGTFRIARRRCRRSGTVPDC
ncbi:hypothetical protein KCP73_00840 [Salmonella enterica subsp. enterica]|nr:hypothetical protein KCP73_00840 [Salmonella enterica subsp. enterica]